MKTRDDQLHCEMKKMKAGVSSYPRYVLQHREARVGEALQLI